MAPPPSPRRASQARYDTTKRRVGTSTWPKPGTSTRPPVGTFSWPRTQVFVRGRHCKVVPYAEDGVMTLVRPGETRRLDITVEPEDADRAWFAIEWQPPPYRGTRFELMWLPLKFEDGPLGKELARQLKRYDRRAWLGRLRRRPGLLVGPGRSPRVSVGPVRGRRLIKRLEMAADPTLLQMIGRGGQQTRPMTTRKRGAL